MLLNNFIKNVIFVILLFLFGILNIQASEKIMLNQIYKSESIKQNKILDSFLPSPKVDGVDSKKAKDNADTLNKAIIENIHKVYPIAGEKASNDERKKSSLSLYFKEIGLILNKNGNAAIQVSLSNLPKESHLKLSDVIGTWEEQNGIIQLHLKESIGGGNAKFSMNGVLLPTANGLQLNGIFTISILGARHVEQLIIPLEKETESKTEKWKFFIDSFNSFEKNQFFKQQNAIERLASEPNEWINGVPVPISFTADMTYSIDGSQLKEKKATVILNKNEYSTVDILIAPEGEFSNSWDIKQSEKIQVTIHNGHVQAVMTSPQFSGGMTWITKNPLYPSEPNKEGFVSLVEQAVIDIQLSKEGNEISGTINAKGKLATTSNVISTFSAKFSGKKQGNDLVEKFAHYIGARPFDGVWDIPKQGELRLRQKQNMVTGTFPKGTLENGLVKDSTLNFNWKIKKHLRNGFLSVASDGVLVGMTWNENNFSFEPIVAFQESIPTNKSNGNEFKIENEEQARELKYLARDLSSIGKNQEAIKIFLQVLEYYKQREKKYAVDIGKSSLSYQNLRDNLISQGLLLIDLPSIAMETGNYPALITSLKAAIHVERELEKTKNTRREFTQQLEQYVVVLNKYCDSLEKLKAAFDRGIQTLPKAGIGIGFDTDNSVQEIGLKIDEIVPDMPASHANIAVGDVIVAIDGVSIKGMDAEKARIALLGESGTPVTLKLLRNGKYRELKIIRVPIFNIQPEYRQEMIQSFTAIRNHINEVTQYFLSETNKLAQLSNNGTDSSISFNKLIATIKEHQRFIETQSIKATDLTQRCLAKSSVALNIFQRFIAVMNEMERNDNEEVKAKILKIDQEEENFMKNPSFPKIDKNAFMLSMYTFSEFVNMQVAIIGKLSNIEHSRKSTTKSHDATETANRLASFASRLDNWRSQMITDEAKIASLDYGQDFYSDYVQLLLDMNLPEQALQASETARARAFADLLKSSRTKKIEEMSNKEFLENLKNLKAPPTDKKFKSLESFSKNTLPTDKELEKLADESLKKSLKESSSITVDEIRQLVRDTGNTVVEYFVLNDSLLTWTISLKPNKEVKIDFHKTLINQKVLDDKVDNLIKGLEPLPELSEKASQAEKNKRVELEKVRTEITKEELKSLYDILIAPIENLLPKEADKIVTIVPHGKLFRVPFSALIQVKNDKTEHYLVQDHTLTYLPSLAVLNLSRQIKREAVTPFSLLAAIKPNLKNDELGKKFEELPALESISKATANFYEPKSTLILSGKEATQEKVLTEAKSRDVVLFYTHAKALLDNPLESYVALTDNLLKAERIKQERLNANLVILAACQTGQGKITGDGVQGVARMFMIAGAKNTMVSLWSVPQETTLQLMYAFHENWKQKKQNIASSLRQAQLELLDMYKTQPSLWAGFIVIGEGK